MEYSLILALIILFLGIILISINKYFSLKAKTIQKEGSFECGITSYSQTRSSYKIQFIIIALLFIPFDLEISSILPYSLVLNTGYYGWIIVILFTLILVVGLVFEISRDGLKIKKLVR